MSASTAIRSTISVLNAKSKSIFEWIVQPLVLSLWPRRSSWWVRNLANIISTARLPISIMVVVWGIYPAYHNRNLGSLYLSLAVMLIVLLTDGIDGALARGLMAVSRYGKAVDPLADKVFYMFMIGSLTIGAWGIVPREVVITMLVFMIPALYFELRLVATSIITERECIRADVAEPAGSNIWGKAKFSLQALAGFMGFGIPFVIAGFSIAMCFLVLSLPMAYMSLRGHQLNLEAIRIKANSEAG